MKAPEKFDTLRSYIEECRSPHLLPLVMAGYHGELTMEQEEDGKFTYYRGENSAFLPFFDQLFQSGPTDVSQFYVTSRFIGAGPKLARLSLEECLALEQVELNFNLAHYKQPYPTFAVEFPVQYAGPLTLNGVRPLGVVVHLGAGPCLLSDVVMSDTTHLIDTISAGHSETTLEEILQNNVGRSLAKSLKVTHDEFALRERLLRVALNYCVLLTEWGHKSLGKDNPKHAARLAELIKKDRKGHKASLEAELKTMPEVVAFSQEVKLYDREARQPASSGEGAPRSSASVHWRRGHMRRQHHGKGLSQTKLVFIRPVLVNAGDFKDWEHTTVEYSRR